MSEVDVHSEEEAIRRAFLGSPSVRVDSAAYGRRCRVYATSEGLRGVPPVKMLEAALLGERYEETVSPDVADSKACCLPNTNTKVELLVADWCPRCPAARLFWSELRDQREFELDVIDVGSARGSALAREHGIRAVPATIIDGTVEFRGTPVPDREGALQKLR